MDARRAVGWGWWAVVVLPAAVTMVTLLWMATPLPMLDDYVHLLAFALGFWKTPDAATRLQMVFLTQVGQYRLVVAHALVALQLLVWGRVRLLGLVWLGNVGLLGTAWPLWREIRRMAAGRGGVVLLLPVSLFLFSLNDAEALDWALGGLQQVWVVLWSVLALYVLTRRHGGVWGLAGAAACAAMASGSSANGLLVWPLGALYLLLLWRGNQARGRLGLPRVLGWCAAGAAVSGLYLWRYTGFANEMAGRGTVWQKGVFLLMFCGGGLENMHHRPLPYVSVPIGAALLGCMGWAMGRRLDRRSPFLYFVGLWVVLTAVAASEERLGLGMAMSLSSRYKIYCDLLLVVCYGAGLDWALAEEPSHGGRRMRGFWRVAVVAGLVVYAGGAVAGGHLLATRRARAELAMLQYRSAPDRASPMFLVEERLSPGEAAMEEDARRMMNEAVRLGIYRLPGR